MIYKIKYKLTISNCHSKYAAEVIYLTGMMYIHKKSDISIYTALKKKKVGSIDYKRCSAERGTHFVDLHNLKCIFSCIIIVNYNLITLHQKYNLQLDSEKIKTFSYIYTFKRLNSL